MLRLVLRAYTKLIQFDLLLVRRDFGALHAKVRQYPVTGSNEFRHSIEDICGAVDMACIWYWKPVLCLQRSAATVCILRRAGISAELVVGTQQMPFRAHAWVEVQGRVVNDKSYTREVYAVLDKC
jgi:hypothetical protein